MSFMVGEHKIFLYFACFFVMHDEHAISWDVLVYNMDKKIISWINEL